MNGRSFLSILHDEAVKLLKSSRHLILTVKDVGRLPHARTTVDQTKWIASSRIRESVTSSAGSAPGTGFRDPRVTSGNHCSSHLLPQDSQSGVLILRSSTHGLERGLFPSSPSPSVLMESYSTELRAPRLCRQADHLTGCLVHPGTSECGLCCPHPMRYLR